MPGMAMAKVSVCPAFGFAFAFAFGLAFALGFAFALLTTKY